MKTIDCTPSWAYVVTMCCEVMTNPNADLETKANCKAELLRLAKIVDDQIAQANEPPTNLGVLLEEMREKEGKLL